MQAVDKPIWLKLYAFLLTVLLPLDWFAPTGGVLREFGAKPATLLLTMGGLCGIFLVSRMSINRAEFTAMTAFAAWFALGFSAVFINFVLGWSGGHYDRDPLIQLITQSLLITACAIAVIGNARLMRAYPIAHMVARTLPWAVLIHLSIFLLEAFGVIQDSSGVLSLFRADAGIMERPSGLYSEPSYFGTFAALYGTALLCIPGRTHTRLINSILAIALYTCAIVIGAKTIVVVAGAQAVFLMLRHARSWQARVSAILMFVAIAGCALFLIQTYSALNVEENLSSAMRFGSTVLASNVVLEGYGLSGIGIGQFHFFYRGEFAPNFLLLSTEGLLQLSPDAENRASTFNFYVRVLLETGVAGLILMMFVLRKLWYERLPDSMTFISVLFAGSLGFLLTQDTYFYPPLVFSSAAILSMVRSRREELVAATAESPNAAIGKT